METAQKEIQSTEGESAQREAPEAPQSVGALLKRERERLGLSRERITEMTRIRTQVVEAIENESWSSLPPPVFVRGFLRSYARVLGLNQDTVTDLYTKLLPPASALPAPPLELSRSRWPRAGFIVFFLALLMGGYGLWYFHSSPPISERAHDAKEGEPEVARAPSQPAVLNTPPVREIEEPSKPEPLQMPNAAQDKPSSPSIAETPARRQADDGDGWLSLTGIVKQRTWVRIRIDGKEEKEYLFQPGSRPQWKGKESFYMLIGNAAGIDFDLNGKRVGNLGNPGQVIRLTLPRDMGQRERVN